MKKTGRVVIDENGRLRASVERPAECEHCGMCQSKTLLMDLPEGQWQPGDTVEVELATDNLLRASALAYMLPLALLVIGLLAGEWLGAATPLGGDGLAAVLAIVGLGLGALLIRVIAPKLNRSGRLQLNVTPCGKTPQEAIRQRSSGDNN